MFSRVHLSFFKKISPIKNKTQFKTKITIATASSPAKIFDEFVKEINVENLEFEVLEVKNKFFGKNIDVAGLIVGQDIIETIKNKNIEHLIIPSVMLKKISEDYSEEFLDGKTISDIKKINTNMKIHVIYDNYSFEEFLNIINNL
jgi:hypothetical protein